MTIKKTAIKGNNLINTDKIKATVDQNQMELVNFSYKYLKEKGQKFKYTQKTTDYFTNLKEKLIAISSISVKEFRANSSKSLRCHPIKFYETSEAGFSIPQEEYIVTEPCQFSVTANEYGRVHGFIIKNTFYIVWLDPEHELYPGN